MVGAYRDSHPRIVPIGIPMDPKPSVHVSPRGEERLRRGHPWIYRVDVDPGRAAPGDIVTMLGPRERRLGDALYSDRSQIALRVLTRGEPVAGDALWRTRLEAAIRFRGRLAIDATAYRLVHGEADLLPSLVVDRYGDWLVLQALSQGIDRRARAIVSALVDLLAPRGILARNDPKVRQLEGLDQVVEVLHGEVPAIDRDPGARGPPTRWTRGTARRPGSSSISARTAQAAARYARGRVLDCIQLQRRLRARARRRTPTRWSRSTSRPTQWPASRGTPQANGIRNVTAREVNVFDELRHFERERRAFRHDRARPAGLREEQGIGAEGHQRLQGDQPARAEDSRAGRNTRHLQLLLQRGRGAVPRHRSRTPRPTPACR